jgi:hypothetical protein
VLREGAAAERIIRAVRESFFDFIEKRRAAFPTVLQRMGEDRYAASLLLRPAAWLSLKQIRVRQRKYIFLTDRHRDLIQRIATEPVAIIGTAREFLTARKLGLDFCSSGDLYLAAHAILFGRTGIPVDRILRRWISFLSQQQDPCYLVLPHDTSPISLLLCKLADECPNIRSVCIQHGLFNAGSDQDDIEGRNALINLVYDEAQKGEMLRRLPSAIVEPMGFPADLPTAEAAGNGELDIVLVGTGTTEQPEQLARAVAIFREVGRAVAPLDARVRYRPHPTERASRLSIDYGMPVNRQDKSSLLSGRRKVFIGFNSTLLYEAHLAGHLVVVLDHDDIPGYQIKRFGLRLRTDQVQQLPGHIMGELADMGTGLSRPDVGLRFKDAISRAELQSRRIAADRASHWSRSEN